MKRSQAFTLLELLVVVSIIALLVAILLPTLAAARGVARATQCLSHHRQIGIGLHSYAADNDERLPSPVHTWVGTVDSRNPGSWFPDPETGVIDRSVVETNVPIHALHLVDMGCHVLPRHNGELHAFALALPWMGCEPGILTDPGWLGQGPRRPEWLIRTSEPAQEMGHTHNYVIDQPGETYRSDVNWYHYGETQAATGGTQSEGASSPSGDSFPRLSLFAWPSETVFGADSNSIAHAAEPSRHFEGAVEGAAFELRLYGLTGIGSSEEQPFWAYLMGRGTMDQHRAQDRLNGRHGRSRLNMLHGDGHARAHNGVEVRQQWLDAVADGTEDSLRKWRRN